MLERARARAAENSWKNVTLISASVEEAAIPLAADAALFHFTHDIMRTPNALANVRQPSQAGRADRGGRTQVGADPGRCR